MEYNYCYGCMEEIAPGTDVCPACGFRMSAHIVEPHQLTPGTLLRERYAVGRVLGEGGFGITYVGKDTVLDLKVAIKEFYMSGYVNRNNTCSTVVHANTGTHGETFAKNRDRFLTEARVLAKFASEEGIVGIRDFFQENNTAYIVMDFLSGETLRSYIDRRGKLPGSRVVQILEPVLHSLGNVHKHDVIHRDISPDNIMLTDDGKVKLLDFGAARQVSKTDIKSLSIILKPGYAPEEQYRSKGKQGPWTDIYALCATMYRCVTGITPDDAMERMFDDKLVHPARLDCDCSPALGNVIMKGLAVRMADRYGSITELTADLARAAAAPNDSTIAAAVKPAADEPATVYVGGTRTVMAAANAASANSDGTVYAGRIDGPTAPAGPDGTVYAGRIDGPTAPANSDGTVYAGRIDDPADPKTKKQPEIRVSAANTGKKRVWWPIGAAAVAVAVIVLAMILPRASKDTGSGEQQSGQSTIGLTETSESQAETQPHTQPETEPETTLPFVEELPAYVAVECGWEHTVVLYRDGTVEAIGRNEDGECNVEDWTDITQISATSFHTVGLKSDGTVVATGSNAWGQCNVSDWTDIVQVSAGMYHTVGLKSDGTVVATGRNKWGESDLQDWSGIVEVSAAYNDTVGLCADGTVIAAGEYAKGKLPGWENVKSVRASDFEVRIVGLMEDGTVKAVGNNQSGQCEVSEWTDVVSLCVGSSYTVGLRSDGTVLICGINDVGQADVQKWTDIQHIASGIEHIVGVTADGVFLAAGANDLGEGSVEVFND